MTETPEPVETAPAPAPEGAAAASGAPAAAPAVELSPAAEAVRDAYAFEGARIHLGALMEGEEPNPAAPVNLSLAMLNRHGLIAGATGTGKTKTLQVIAEQVAAAGTPVFVADMKGDLSGIAVPGADSPKIRERAAARGQQWQPRAGATEFYSLGGQGTGVPIRTTVSDFGPLLLSKVLQLNETQESSLALIFHYADTHGLGLLDLKDLRALIQFLTSDDEGKKELKSIGGISSATAGVILRELTAFEASGADAFFGEPAFDTKHLLRRTPDGAGIISCLELPAVAERPALFSTFMMWLLADLYQDLPEVGDAEKPELVFFFDEAHLLFADASKDFLQQVVQTVRLIRSKGVGVFFITQTPKDVPADVLAQLGNRVQHALRAFTPDDQKALNATVRTFPKSGYDLEELLTTLGTGEAVVTVLSEKGAPTPVAWTRMLAPTSKMAPASEETMDRVIGASALASKYSEAVDRESAYERLQNKFAQAPAESDNAEEKPKAAPKEAAKPKEEPGMVSQVVRSSAFKSFMRSAGTQIGREITRSLFGTGRRR